MDVVPGVVKVAYSVHATYWGLSPLEITVSIANSFRSKLTATSGIFSEDAELIFS